MNWLSVYAINLTCIIFIGTLGIYLRREAYPLNGRSFNILVLTNFLAIMIEVLQIVRMELQSPCFISSLSLGIGLLLSYVLLYNALHLLSRTLHMQELSRLTVKGPRYSLSQPTQSHRPNFLQRSKKYLKRWSIIQTGLLITLYVVMYLIDSRYQTEMSCNISLSPLAIIILAWFVFYLVGLLVVSIALSRLPNDGFFIQPELLSISGICLLAAILLGGLYLGGLITLKTSALGLIQIWITILFFLSTVVPMLATFKPETPPESPNIITSESLQDVLAKPESKSCFFDFLQTEFSAENLLFYDQVSHWLNLSQTQHEESTLRDAQGIYERFIGPAAIHEINLEATKKRRLQQALEHTSVPDLRVELTLARDEIYSLMEQDSYRRFQSKSQIHIPASP